jgi:hypothetical protein
MAHAAVHIEIDDVARGCFAGSGFRQQIFPQQAGPEAHSQQCLCGARHEGAAGKFIPAAEGVWHRLWRVWRKTVEKSIKLIEEPPQ